MTVVFSFDFKIFLSAEKFRSITTLRFYWVDLSEAKIECIQGILKTVENIHLERCHITGNVFCQIANYCEKLKYLDCTNCDEMSMALFLQHYPALEHLKYTQTRLPFDQLQVHELKSFLEKNLKLKHFESNFDFLWQNRALLIETNVQLDLLKIDFNRPCKPLTMPTDDFFHFIQKLHDRGFYKSLYLSIYKFLLTSRNSNYNYNQDLRELLCKLPALEILKCHFDSFPDLASLANLRKLCILKSSLSCTHMETMAKHLTKLERLTLLEWTTFNEILLFIRHAKNLKTIKAWYLDNQLDQVLDVYALNQERKKLPNARPVSIYVKEKVYLSAKWNVNDLNLSHVKIMRYYYNFAHD